jgi:hypothetical protein
MLVRKISEPSSTFFEEAGTSSRRTVILESEISMVDIVSFIMTSWTLPKKIETDECHG